MNWEKVTKPRNEGGPGDPPHRGKEFGTVRRTCTERVARDEKPWTKILMKARVGEEGNSVGGNSLNRNAVQLGARVCRPGERWMVEGGLRVGFRWDDWSGMGPLRNPVQGTLSQAEVKRRVISVIRGDGEWNRSEPSITLPEDVINSIVSVPRSILRGMEDLKFCKFSGTGHYETQSADPVIPRAQLNNSMSSLGI